MHDGDFLHQPACEPRLEVDHVVEVMCGESGRVVHGIPQEHGMQVAGVW